MRISRDHTGDFCKFLGIIALNISAHIATFFRRDAFDPIVGRADFMHDFPRQFCPPHPHVPASGEKEGKYHQKRKIYFHRAETITGRLPFGIIESLMRCRHLPCISVP